MGILTQNDALTTLRNVGQATFNKAFTELKATEMEQMGDYAKVIYTFNCGPVESFLHTGMETFAQAREIKERWHESSLKEQTFRVENKTYGSNATISLDMLRVGMTSGFIEGVRMLPVDVLRKKMSLVGTVFADIETLEGYDGVAFASALHPTGAGGTQTNLGSSQLTMANITTTVAAMRNLTAFNGDFIDVIPDTLIVPPALEETARAIANSNTVFYSDRGTTWGATKKFPTANVYEGRFDVVVLKEITDTDAWGLAQLRRGGDRMKPVILQTSEDLTAFNDLSKGFDSMVRKRHWFAQWIGTAKPWMWQTVYWHSP